MQLSIAPPSTQLGRKARIFACDCVGYGTAPQAVWDQAHEKTIRPVWIALGGSEHAVTPFLANFRMGKIAESPSTGYGRNKGGTKFEILRTTTYVWSTHRVPTVSGGDVLVFGFAADLCNMAGTGVDPDRVAFVCLTPTWYAAESNLDPIQVQAAQAWARTQGMPNDQADTLPSRLPHILRTMAMLDRRISLPLIPDLRFMITAYTALNTAGVLAQPGMGPHSGTYGYNDWRSGVKSHGLLSAHMQMTAISGATSKIERTLTETMQRYHHGTTRK